MKVYYIVMALVLWFSICFVAIIYSDWIAESFRRWLKFRRIKKAYKGEELLRSIIDETNEEIDLIQKQLGGR